jgi:hypothetical protein
MIEAGGFDANERFATLQRPKILDRDGEHVWPAGAGGPSHGAVIGERGSRHGHNVSNCLYCVSLHFRRPDR